MFFWINTGSQGVGTLGLPQTRCLEPYGIYFLFFFRVQQQVPIYFGCLAESCNAVKFQNFFVDYETSPE